MSPIATIKALDYAQQGAEIYSLDGASSLRHWKRCAWPASRSSLPLHLVWQASGGDLVRRAAVATPDMCQAFLTVPLSYSWGISLFIVVKQSFAMCFLHFHIMMTMKIQFIG